MTDFAGALSDTHPDAFTVQTELYRKMSPARKLALVEQLTAAVCAMSLAGLRRRHPGESEDQLLLKLARVRLGDDLVDRAYGTAPE